MSVVIAAEDVENTLDAMFMSIEPQNLYNWFEGKVFPWFSNETVERFAYEGDFRSGHWPPLSEATEHIRRNLGYEPDWPINIRSGELFDWIVKSHTTTLTSEGAELRYPGESVDPVTDIKFRHAQEGTRDNPMIAGAVTPPRPVIGWAEERDPVTIIELLALHITRFMMGGGRL